MFDDYDLRKHPRNPGNQHDCKWRCDNWDSVNSDSVRKCTRFEFDRNALSCKLFQQSQVLPLSKAVKTIAVLGSAACAEDSKDEWWGSPYVGGGSGHVMTPTVVTPLTGIKERAAKAGVKVVHDCNNSLAVARDAGVDIIIVVAAARTTEGHDRKNLSLEEGADELINSAVTIAPTVVLMETPGAVLTPWRGKTAAIANLFLGGEQVGMAWAAILFGDEVPTGKLPITFPGSEADAIRPDNDLKVVYDEKLFTSYRNPSVHVAYPFGHGLSYTTFGFSNPWVFSCKHAACVAVTVTNTGGRAGNEVAQAYIRFTNSTAEPKLVLRGFNRTRVLHPGEQQEVHFAFRERDLSVYSVGKGWKRVASVQVHIGSSSAHLDHVVTIGRANHWSAPTWPMFGILLGISAFMRL